MVLSVDIANRAIHLIGDNQPPITGSGNYPVPIFDTSPAGLTCAQVYVGVVNTVGRQFGWDFSRNIFQLIPTGTPVGFWKYAYAYPLTGSGLLAIQVRQIIPATLADPNNPLPTRWEVVNDGATKLILTNIPNAAAVISNQIDENQWDAGFTEEVVRLLANYIAMGVAGRPETAQAALESMKEFGALAETRDS